MDDQQTTRCSCNDKSEIATSDSEITSATPPLSMDISSNDRALVQNSATPLLLEDFRLNTSTLADNKNIEALAENPVGQLSHYCYFPEFYCPPPPPIGKTCEANFLSGRRNRQWYPQKSVDKIKYGGKKACPGSKSLVVNEKISVPIFYADASTTWNAAQIQGKVNEATTWFDDYCINLSIYDVKQKAGEAAQLARLLAKVKNQKYYDQVIKFFKTFRKRLGNPNRFFLVLFVDPYVIRDKRRGAAWTGPISVALNLWRKPVILIPSSPDLASTNILTHELIHALGKPFGPGVSTVGYKGANQDNTWNDGGCKNDMGNSGRGNALVPLNLPPEQLMDWASYWQFNSVGNIS